MYSLAFFFFTEFFNSPTTILNHFKLQGSFSVPASVHTAAGIAWGKISKATQSWLRECRKTHAPLAPMWIKKERELRKEFTSKQVRPLQTSFTDLKGKVFSVDSYLKSLLWSTAFVLKDFPTCLLKYNDSEPPLSLKQKKKRQHIF